MKSVAITGGRGFIGGALVQKHIKQGHRVRILSRQYYQSLHGVECFKGDLSNPSHDFRKFVDGVDVLYHCAGEITNYKLMPQLHIEGTRHLVNAARSRIGRWIQLSSVGAYGVHRSGIITEATPENPSGVYEETKTAADEIVKESGIPYTILRPSNVFGPQMPNKSLFQLIEMVKKGLYFHIGQPGSLASYIHVDDVAEALWLVGNDNHSVDSVYIISQSIETERMVEAFADGLGVKQPAYRLPEWLVRLVAGMLGQLPGFSLTLSRVDALTSRCRYDSSKLQQDLNFRFGATLEAQCRSLTIKK